MSLAETLTRLARTRGVPSDEDALGVLVEPGKVTVTWPAGTAVVTLTLKTLSRLEYDADRERILRGETTQHHEIENVDVSCTRSLRSAHKTAAVQHAQEVLGDERAALLLDPTIEQESRIRRLDLAQELLAGPRPRTLTEDLADAEKVAPAPQLWKEILESNDT